MVTEDEKNTELAEENANAALTVGEPRSLEAPAPLAIDGEIEAAPEDDGAQPAQLGSRRFVYAAYFAGGILVAFLLEKTLSTIWTRLGQWKPQFGEPKEEIVMAVSAVIGAAAAMYYWTKTRTRELIEDVASELAKVTWPTRTEVMNNTVVVIVTTLFATVFFTLMDRFWSFVTGWVYGT